VKQRHESFGMDADATQWRHIGTITQCSCSMHFAYLDFLFSTAGIGASLDTDKGRRSKTNMNFRHIMVPKISSTVKTVS